MKREPLSRRSLLKGAGGVAIALPMLEAMLPNAVQAAPSPKKFVSLFSGCGVTPDTFYPTGTATKFTLNESMASLKDFQSKLLLFDGITNRSGDDPDYGGHQGSHVGMISGAKYVYDNSFSKDRYENMRPTLPSLDQIIAEKLWASGAQTRFKSIQIGVTNATGGNRFDRAASFTSSTGLLDPEQSPQNVFDRLFKDASTPVSSAESALIAQKRKSILDFVKDRYTVLNARLGAEDKQRVEKHLTSIREIEQQLAGGVSGTCKIPTKPAATINANTDLKAYADLQINLMVAALACDLTHVASLTWFGTRGGNYTYAKGITGIAISGNHHNISHSADANSIKQITAINNYIAGRMGQIMSALSTYSDSSGGNLLDNTMVLWWNELGYSNGYIKGKSGHMSDPSPFVLGGGNGGGIQMGRFLDFKAKPQSNNNLLLSIYRAVTGDDELAVIGDKKYCTGVLPGFA